MPRPDFDFRDLMDQIRNGSEEAAWDLVDRYGERVRRAVRRSLNHQLRSKFDSMDFVQLVWSSLFRTRKQLTRFDQPDELAAFLVTMARNKVGMEVRRRLSTEKYNVNKEQSLEERRAEVRMDAVDPQPPPIEVAIARERWHRIVENQPEHYRKIVELRLRGNTYQEIADELGIAESTARRVLQRLSRESVV